MIRVWEREDQLFFEIEDDGAGCDLESARGLGNGLTNMTDRIAALGGRLSVESRLGAGTTVQGVARLAVPTRG